ncbi:MAG: hypothetical protein Q4D34_01650 [Eggerthellaceae bacterium]|nr:hypothetical protein [Eggerthellaceae bacterium]
MNNSANSNMYYHTIDRAWDLYACHLEGNRDGFICVISNASLSDAARNALEASMEKLGYGSRACTFISLADASSDAVAPLSAQTLLELIELLDPAILVAADAESARALSEAFRTRLPLFDLSHIAGRATVAFASFTGMLDSMPNKQKAWAILKRLAR